MIKKRLDRTAYFVFFYGLELERLVSVSYVTGDSGFGMDDSFLQLSLFPGDGNLKISFGADSAY